MSPNGYTPVPGVPDVPDVPDPRFASQKEKVVQILKNRNDFLAATTRDEDPAAPRPFDPERSGEDARRRMPINAEVMRRWSDHPAAVSFRILEAELQTIRNLSPLVYAPLYDTFLHPEAGDADYDRLKQMADTKSLKEKIKSVAAERNAVILGKTRAEDPEARAVDLTRKMEEIRKKIRQTERPARSFARVEMALYMLVTRLIDTRLYAVFPSRYLPGGRGQTMEENYRAIHRIFRQECDIHTRTMKRYRKRAYETTAELCACSVPTVERAVHFAECVDGGAGESPAA